MRFGDPPHVLASVVLVLLWACISFIMLILTSIYKHITNYTQLTCSKQYFGGSRYIWMERNHSPGH